MQIDLDHIHHWMQAIRQSQDPIRTLDAFWQGQLRSKEWLCDTLQQIVTEPASVDIYGGWVGTLSSMLFLSGIPITKIRTIDIDPTCKDIAINMNKLEEIQGRFEAITADMCEVSSTADIIINTSCEHITQSQYDQWLSLQPTTSLLVLQSNDYDISEHVRLATNLEEFKAQSNIDVVWAGEFKLPLYTRFMIIGRKHA